MADSQHPERNQVRSLHDLSATSVVFLGIRRSNKTRKLDRKYLFSKKSKT